MKIEIQLDDHKASSVNKILEGLQEAGLIQGFQRVEKANSNFSKESDSNQIPPVLAEQSATDFVEHYRDLVD